MPQEEQEIDYLESILTNGSQIPVLDKGFVRLVDHMGSDASIVQSARVSYGKGTKTKTEDQGLINYLMRKWHTTPFEMCELKFHVKLPIVVARQWIRHRTWTFNEYSCRYSEVPDDIYTPEPERVCTQSKTNKQGSGSQLIGRALDGFLNVTQNVQNIVTSAIKFGEANDVARETNRNNMLVSHYTEWYCKVDLHNLLHFLKLRLDPHAQYEIRCYAEVIASMVAQLYPMTWQAFVQYRLAAVTFSMNEQLLLRQIIDRNKMVKDDQTMSMTEYTELVAKLDQIFSLDSHE